MFGRSRSADKAVVPEKLGGIFPGGTSSVPQIRLDLNVDGRALAQASLPGQRSSRSHRRHCRRMSVKIGQG
jgi:hypothetical protein